MRYRKPKNYKDKLIKYYGSVVIESPENCREPGGTYLATIIRYTSRQEWERETFSWSTPQGTRM